MQRIADPDVAGVAVYDLSRIARSSRLVQNLHHELERRNLERRNLERRNLELIVANMPHGFVGATGRYMLNMLAGAAQLQADLDSERMVGITRTKHEAGGHNGRDPYGYRTARDDEGRVAQPHRLEPVEDEAAVIREAFDAYGSARIASHAAVAADLNRRGIARRGKPWSKQSVRDVFRRAPFYAGQAVYRRGKDQRPGLHEPIISAEQRQLVERIARRQRWIGKPTPRHRTWPLQGVAYCGACKRRMWSETHVRAGRGEWRYYRCPGRLDRACDAPSVRAEPGEAFVIEHLASHASPPELVAAMRAELARMRHLPGEELTGQRGRLEARRKRLDEQYEWSMIDPATYRAKRAEVDAELGELPPPAASNVLAFDRAAARIMQQVDSLREASPAYQREIIRYIVERVEMHGREVGRIIVRPEALPFFASFDSLCGAPPEGFEPPTPALGRRRSIH